MALKRFSGNASYNSETIHNSDIFPFTHLPEDGVNNEDGKITLSELKSNINKEQNLRLNVLEEAKTNDEARLTAVESYVPTGTTSTNKLVNKSYVDDSIQTNTAIFRGNFDTLNDLNNYQGTKTNNDYAVVTADEEHSNETWRYKYNGTSWTAEYKINETPLTEAQTAALDSGITEAKVTKLDGIEEGAEKNTVTSVNGLTGAVEISGLTTDSSLSTTSENPVQNKVVTANMGTFFNTQTQTAIKTLTVNGISSLSDGLTIKVCFKNGHSGSSFTLNVNSLGAKYIYVNKNGTATKMTNHAISSVNWYIQKYTTIELIYDSSVGGWVVIGNPEVITYTSDTVSFRIKADGYITQYGTSSTSTEGTNTVTYPVAMATNTYAISIIRKDGTSTSVNAFYSFSQYTAATTTSLTFVCAPTTRQNGYSWIIKGY